MNDVVKTELSVAMILVAICLPFLLSSLIVYIYRKNQPAGTNLYYFSYTLMLFPPLVSVITLLIENNIARGLGLLGALSVVRFRSALKSPLDAIYIFWALAVGLACGTGAFIAAILIMVCCAFFVLIVKKIMPLSEDDFGSILKIIIRNNNNTESQKCLEKIIAEYSSQISLLNSFFTTRTSLTTYIYNINLNDLNKREMLIQAISQVHGVECVEHSNEVSSPFIF